MEQEETNCEVCWSWAGLWGIQISQESFENQPSFTYEDAALHSCISAAMRQAKEKSWHHNCVVVTASTDPVTQESWGRAVALLQVELYHNYIYR